MFKNLFSLLLIFSLGAFWACEDETPGTTLLDEMSEEGNLTTFIEAMRTANLENVLKNGNPITIFAPTDDAFQDFFQQNGYSGISDIPVDTLQDLMLYHMLGATTNLAQLGSNYYLAPSPSGPENNFVAIFLEDRDSGHRINGTANIIKEDVNIQAGFYNIIDKVLKIPNNYDILQGNEIFSDMLEGVDNIDGFADLLTGSIPYTFLILSNENLKASLNQVYGVETLAQLEPDIQSDLMQAHTLLGFIQGEDFLDPFQEKFPTLLDGFEATTINGERITFEGGSEVSIANIQTSNGNIHVLTQLLDF